MQFSVATSAQFSVAIDKSGVYPRRVRGTPGRHDAGGGGRGSIPAGAGDPPGGGSRGLPARGSPRRGGGTRPSGCSRVLPTRVYPRGCGEPSRKRSYSCRLMGLSPRVRGTPQWLRRTRAGTRSIPAGAGNPPAHEDGREDPGVYPRGCGEPENEMSPGHAARGLSPRVRGTLAWLSASSVVRGSIPAGAGNPNAPTARRVPGRVYPRGCGEPIEAAEAKIKQEGLSPRVRGTREPTMTTPNPTGSIPAGAGNPRMTWPKKRFTRVYPRGCGEPPVAAGPCTVTEGLSPRVRGTHNAA